MFDIDKLKKKRRKISQGSRGGEANRLGASEKVSLRRSHWRKPRGYKGTSHVAWHREGKSEGPEAGMCLGKSRRSCMTKQNG